jgi:hypothetical protein
LLVRELLRFREWRNDERPLRRAFRATPILTLLGFVAVLLTIAALMIGIGIGETQIIASEYPAQHRADIWGNGWFYLGFGGFMVGIALAAYAACAYASQAKGRREFPNLVMRVLLRSDHEGVQEPGHPSGHGQVVRLAFVRLLLKNEEQDRDVTFHVTLSLKTIPAVVPVPAGSPPATSQITPLGFPAVTWVPAQSEVTSAPPLMPLPLPLRVEAGTETEGDLFFAIPQHWVPGLVKGQRGRVTVVDRKTGKLEAFEWGYPHDEP